MAGATTGGAVVVAGVVLGESSVFSHSDSPSKTNSDPGPSTTTQPAATGDGKVESIRQFPQGAGHVDVTRLGADPTGKIDCTAAVQAAITKFGPGFGRPLTLFWPAGRYRLSAPLLPKDSTGRWCSSLTHQGEGTSRTVLFLADSTKGYDDPGSPRAVLYFASVPEPDQDGFADGYGNGAFHNFVFDLTVDVGHNPGAIAIDYLANNVGAIRRTALRATTAHTGVAMTRTWPGPCLIDRLHVSDGFTFASYVDNYFYSVMFERCSFNSIIANGANVVGFHLCTFARPLQTTNGGGVTVLVPSAPGQSTSLTVRPAPAARVVGTVATQMAPFKLRGALAPDVAWDPPHLWINAHHYGTLQAAVDAGSTVYFPAPSATAPGRLPDATVILPPTLKHLNFMDGGPDCTGFTTGKPVFETSGDTTEPLTIERGWMTIPQTGNPSWIIHKSTRPLVIRDITLQGGGATPGIVQMPGAGPIYVDDAYCSVEVAPKGSLYARQLNWESNLCPAVTNRGGTAWIFGLKTENGQSPVLLTTGGGHSELLVGELYPVSGLASGDPAIETVDATHTVQFCTYTNGPVGPPADYDVYVKITVNGRTTSYGRSHFVARGYGTYVFQAN